MEGFFWTAKAGPAKRADLCHSAQRKTWIASEANGLELSGWEFGFCDGAEMVWSKAMAAAWRWRQAELAKP